MLTRNEFIADMKEYLKKFSDYWENLEEDGAPAVQSESDWLEQFMMFAENLRQ